MYDAAQWILNLLNCGAMHASICSMSTLINGQEVSCTYVVEECIVVMAKARPKKRLICIIIMKTIQSSLNCFFLFLAGHWKHAIDLEFTVLADHMKLDKRTERLANVFCNTRCKYLCS